MILDSGKEVIFEGVKIRGHIIGSNYMIYPLSSAGNTFDGNMHGLEAK